MLANTPEPPYYAVIFSSIRTENDDDGYNRMAVLMETLARQQPGFLGFESARHDTGITVSYWKDLESIKLWRAHAEHQIAQEKGKALWYREYKVRIAKVERDYDFTMASSK
ncbi:antibiotic biosynthesis monooxygenase family protein [Gaetbulibacter aestuarii]|uniref:Antibiotic biosynthesis monooxygenase n=1 Tax=Gaetbulibacter aestuarii TaxID=1502358 RepID=A0ABW7MUW8_9FLAO